MQSYLVLAGVVLTFLTALVGWLSSRGNAKKLTKIDINVDGRITDMGSRIDQLTGALQGAGVDVPAKLARSVPPAPLPGPPAVPPLDRPS
jgi:hypothetical protein